MEFPLAKTYLSTGMKNIIAKYCRKAVTQDQLTWARLDQDSYSMAKMENHQPDESIQGPQPAASVSKIIQKLASPTSDLALNSMAPKLTEKHALKHIIHTHIHDSEVMFNVQYSWRLASRTLLWTGIRFNCIHKIIVWQCEADTYLLFNLHVHCS